MTRRMFWMLIIVGVILAGVFGWLFFVSIMTKKFMANFGNQPITVATYTASNQEWTPTLHAVGTLRAVSGTDIASQLAGVVADVPFSSDSEVAKGDVILQLDDADDIARLNALKASAVLARQNYERNKSLISSRAISQSTLDTTLATLKSAEAQVNEAQALVNKKRIVAPFDGHIGIRRVDVGQYVTAGQKITTLQALDPIFLDFAVPQKHVSLIRKDQIVKITTDAFPDTTFSGKIAAIDPKADVDTRNISVRAQISNPDHKLLPGMFASAEITVGAPEPRLTLPQVAITYNPYGETVYIVSNNDGGEEGKSGLTVRQRFIVTGETRGDQVAITEGLKEGEVVVTAGQLKLKSGSPVVVNNDRQLSNDPAPMPVDQ